MTAAEQPAPPPETVPAPATFLATSVALDAIDQAVRAAQAPSPADESGEGRSSSEQALAALLLLREVREQLAAWEPGLIEAARDAGASWADLAGPLGVASRQAAERRYLRVRPGAPGTTGEQRVQATRDRRAGDRNITHWARDNSADLRQLAGQITALTRPPPERPITPRPPRHRPRRQRPHRAPGATHRRPPPPPGNPPRPRRPHRHHHPPHRPPPPRQQPVSRPAFSEGTVAAISYHAGSPTTPPSPGSRRGRSAPGATPKMRRRSGGRFFLAGAGGHPSGRLVSRL